MTNLLYTIAATLLSGSLEYISTNGFSWKGVLIGAAVGLMTYISPSPKKK